jgi:transketolase
MRNVFFDLLKSRMRSDKRLFFVVADMGFGLVDPFQQEFPDRFVNVGIAEQNMAGICAGLCNAGFRPLCYTISNFLVERCFEQLRNDVCLHDYPVTFIGTSTGFDNGGLGPTHQVIDDIGCVKALPNLRIYSPSTVSAMRLAFEEILTEPKPAYLRIGKGAYDLKLQSGSLNHMVADSGKSSVLVITHGNILENILKGLAGDDTVSIYCLNRLKPLEPKELTPLFSRFPTIVVIEDHFGGSGLYNTLCQFAVESGLNTTRLLSRAPSDRYEERAGDKNYFAEKYGLSAPQIRSFITSLSAHSSA